MSLSHSVDTNLKADSFQCPLCERQFAQSVIETHVNKCIFLNTQPENNLKRAGSYGENNETGDSAKYKRLKTDAVSVCATTSKEISMPVNIPNQNNFNTDMFTVYYFYGEHL